MRNFICRFFSNYYLWKNLNDIRYNDDVFFFKEKILEYDLRRIF